MPDVIRHFKDNIKDALKHLILLNNYNSGDDDDDHNNTNNNNNNSNNNNNNNGYLERLTRTCLKRLHVLLLPIFSLEI